jgi:hypothetical protein
MAMEMQVMAWDRQENRFKGPTLENWISIDNRDIKSRSCKPVFPGRKPLFKTGLQVMLYNVIFFYIEIFYSA